jgi:glycosyltransferase involved in cell wall biosynthesis
MQPDHFDGESRPLNGIMSTPELRDELIVCFSNNAWHGRISGRQQVMSRLARHNDVVYVDPPCSFRDAFRLTTLTTRCLSVEWVMPRLRVVRFPPWLGVSFKPWLESMLLRQRIVTLRSLFARDDRRPLVHCWHPDYWRYMRYFEGHFVCYHVYDEISSFLGVDAKEVRANDWALSRRADVVLAVSEPLTSERRRFGRPAYTVYNGANYDHFARINLPEPVDFADVPRPRLCFVSRLHAHVDYDVLNYLAEHTSYRLIIVGPVCRMSEDLTKKAYAVLHHPNVHWCGERSPVEVPAYVAHSDVCLIPYKLDGVTLVAATPQKMFEYLAAGKPVIASEMPPMRKFAPHVRFASTLDDWIQQVHTAVVTDNDELQAARRALARENSWDAQVERIGSIISMHKARVDSRNSRLDVCSNMHRLDRNRYADEGDSD